MPKPHKPNSVDDVYGVMKNYVVKKQYNVSDFTLHLWAEQCYLYYEGRAWASVKYYPAVVMKWVLTNVSKSPDKYMFKSQNKPSTNLKIKGKSVRDRILEERNNAGFKKTE
jgi:hypothetical protein